MPVRNARCETTKMIAEKRQVRAAEMRGTDNDSGLMFTRPVLTFARSRSNLAYGCQNQETLATIKFWSARQPIGDTIHDGVGLRIMTNRTISLRSQLPTHCPPRSPRSHPKACDR